VPDWATQRKDREARLAAAAPYAQGKFVEPRDATALLELFIRPGDRVCIEGDNRKQADFLARALADVNPAVVYDISCNRGLRCRSI
jgi:malonate decarboxylase alpha subunit